MYVNFQYSTTSCVSYPSSTKTFIWAVAKPRVPWSVPVKTFVGDGVKNCTGFILTCESPSPCSTVGTCCARVGGLLSASGDSAHDAVITCKTNICKQS